MPEQQEDMSIVSMPVEQMWDDIMQDETLTPMFFARKGFMVPVLDEGGKENSWQRVLMNNH